MRRALLLVAALAAAVLAIAGCGAPSTHARLWLTPSHVRVYTACVSSDCGVHAATLNWQIPVVSGQTGYNLLACQQSSGTCTPTKKGSATSSPFTFTGMDCGQTYTLEVQAHNSGGTGIGTAWPTSYTTPACPGGQTTNCFSSPSACGYPDPTTAGSTTPCASLTTMTSGNVPAGWTLTGVELQPPNTGTSGSHVVLSGWNVPYWVYVGSSSYVDFVNDCFNIAGSSVQSGEAVINQSGGGTHLTVNHVTIVPAGCSTAYNNTSCSTTASDEHSISLGPNSSVTNSVIAGAEEPITVNAASNATITGNYLISNGYLGATQGNHTEDLFIADATGVDIENNTILNPFDQQSAIFAQVNTSSTPCDNQFTIKGNLLAGGILTLDLCTHSSSIGTSTMDIENNHFARCPPATSTSDGSGHYCNQNGAITPGSNTPVGSSIGSGQDTNGYWPLVGYGGYDGDMYCGQTGWTWSGNVYDDTGATVGC